MATHLTSPETTTGKDFCTLVIVPASVIVNWARECRRFTDLPIFIAHGADKEHAVTAWADITGSLICTYDGARTLNLPAPGLVIVNEADMLKNPGSKRSQACAQLIDAADYGLLMTSTPLENKVSEYVSLVGYIQPELITRGMSADNFRARIARSISVTIRLAFLMSSQNALIPSIGLIRAQLIAPPMTTKSRMETGWGMRRSALLAPSGTAPPAKMKRIIELFGEAEEQVVRH